MKKYLDAVCDRRDFLKRSLRIGAGSAIIAGGIILGIRKPKEGTRDCVLKNPCRGCAKYAGCDLPRANEQRRRWTDA